MKRSDNKKQQEWIARAVIKILVRFTCADPSASDLAQGLSVASRPNIRGRTYEHVLFEVISTSPLMFLMNKGLTRTERETIDSEVGQQLTHMSVVPSCQP